MIKKIIKSLKEIGLEPTLEEVIDILWLTNKISKDISKDSRSSTAPNNVDTQQHPNSTFNKEEIKSLYSNQNNTQNLAPQDNNKEIERTINTTNITPINIPTTTNTSFISSATLQKLRLLKYPAKSKTLSTIDEEQTVKRIIEQDIWSPIMKPIRSHRFDMAFVVDTSDSMFIWKKVIKDFEFSLKSLGAFRNFEKWRIFTNSTKPELYKETTSTSEQVLPRNYKEISGTSDISKIIFLITDCVSNCWYNGEVTKILTEWGKNHIVVIVQVLPESLWIRTALGKMLQVHISAPFSEAKNSQLKTRPINPYDEEDCNCSFPIPTLNLEPKPILEWIKLLKGMPNNSVLGITPFKNPVKLSTLEDPYFEDCYSESYVKQTLDNFWAASSPKAQRLAILMSAIPFDLDLIFLIQKNLLKESDLSHLAEVFLSGLIKKTKQVKDENKENLSYDFIPQARQLLLDSLSSSDIKALSEQLSFYIEKNFGTSFNFLSFIEDPNSLNDIQVNKHTKPFIGITVEVLKRLGSKYNKLVTTLEEKIKLPTPDSSLYSIEIVGDGSYYEDIELVVDKLNKAQNKFKFYLSKEQNSLIGIPFADRYITSDIFEILRNYRNNSKQSKPYFIAILNKELISNQYRNLFGSHEANEGLATISLYNHKQYTNTSKYLCYYLIRYCLSFIKPTLLSHEETRGCFFDKKLNKQDILKSINSPSLCSDCLTNLKPEFDTQLSESYEKMVDVLKSISSEIPQEEIPFIQPTLNFASLSEKHDEKQYIQELIKKASELQQTANFEEAIKLYDEAITLSESYLNSQDIFFIEALAEATMKKGLTLRDLGQLENSLYYINEAINYYKQNSKLDIHRVGAIVNKAAILTKLSRHSESILSCDEGISLIKLTSTVFNLEETQLIASLLNNKGESFNKLSRLSQALHCYEEGISLCEKFGKDKDIPIKLYDVLAALLSNKAIIFNKIDNNIEAEQLQDKAVFYYNELVNKEGEKWQPALAQALMAKAISLHNLNNFNEAISCYVSAFHLLTTLIEKGHFQLKTKLARVFHNKAGVLKDINDFAEAIIEYDKAIEIRQEIVKTQQRIDISGDLASSFLAKANLLKELNQLSEARNLYNKAEDIYSDLVENKHLSQFILELASVYSHKGNLLKEVGETQQAISYHDKAISYYETLLQEQENQYLSKNLANIFSDKAFTLWDINNKEQAIFYFDKAIEIYRSLIQVETSTKLQRLFANALINKANILNQINSLDSIIYCDEAIQHYKILLEKNKEVNVIKAFIGAYNIKSNIAAKSGAIQKAIEYCDEIIRFTRDLEQDIYKNIYQEIVMILTNKAFYLLAINNLSEALNISNEAIDFYNILLQGISSIKTKEHFTLASNLAKTLSRKANTLHKLNRFEDSLNTYNQTIYWQKLCVQSGLNQLTPNLLENLFDDLSIRTIIRTTLNLLDDLVADIKDVFEIVKPFLLLESMEELRWKEYIAQLNNLPISQRDQIYSKVRDSSKDLSLALRITNQIPPEITSTPNPTIVGAIKEDSTVYYTQKDISREFWGDNKNSRRLTNLIYEIVNEKSYGIISIGKALRNVQENFPDFWANEKLFFYPLTDNRPVFPARILVHTNLPITNSSNQDIFLSLSTQKQQIYLLDIPEYKQRKLYCQISINPQFEQTQHLIVTANNKILLPLEITLEINISPSIANFQSCENAYTFLLAGQHFLNFLRKPIKKLKIYFDVNYISKIETHFTLDISKELEKLDFSHVDAKDVISNYKYIDNLVSQLDKIRIQQDLTKTNLVNTTTLETKETLEKELKEWQQEELIWLIRQGKDTWNNWRYRHPEQNIDLSNRQLKLDLGKSKTWLTSFNLSYANLQKCDLSSLELGQANLQGANLSNSILSYANIALTNFTKATLKNVEIENTVVIGVNFTETDFTGSNLTAINLRESKLDKANFSDCNLTKTQIVNSTLSETNFAGSYWNDTKLIDADLTKATGFDKIIHQGTSTLIFTNAIEISNLPTQILQNCKIEFSSKTPKHWLLRTKPHITEINKVYEGREWQYEIVPYEAISQGDIVHFWRNSEQDIYGWGEVIKNPGLPNNFSLQQNQSVKLDVKIKAMSSDSIDKNTIKHYVPEIIDLVKSSSIGLGVIPLPNLQVERLNNLYPLHRMVSPPNLLTVAGRSSASIQSNQQQISTFEYQIVKVDKTGKIIERYRKERQQYIEDLGNGVVLEMVEIPFGSFMMGSPHGEGYDWEKPQHKVEVPAFYMGKYQVTQEQWQSIMGSNPSYFKEDKKLPVEQVSWNDAVEFCKRLSEKTNKIYRLPSEAEWEYACRAGTKTPFAFGETINPNIVNYDGNYPYGQAAKGKYRKKITVVGSLGVANDFGLYDMHGNVWEWCQDEWHTDYNIAPINGNAWGTQHSNNTNRLFRGGSYDLSAYYCRSASRGNSMPGSRHFYLGLRLVMVVSQ